MRERFTLRRKRKLRRWFSSEMKTLFVSGSDTDVGKTWVVGALAALFAARGCSVQVVKPVETGVSDSVYSDVQNVLNNCLNASVTGYTLSSYPLPIAPVAAAEQEGELLNLASMVDRVNALPDTDWRIVEGAGSLAAPVDCDGADWRDFAEALKVERTVLVVEDRVGAIGQARMLYAYARAKGLSCGVWLNEIREQDLVARNATHDGVRSSGIPLWATQRFGSRSAEVLEDFWL